MLLLLPPVFFEDENEGGGTEESKKSFKKNELWIFPDYDTGGGQVTLSLTL